MKSGKGIPIPLQRHHVLILLRIRFVVAQMRWEISAHLEALCKALVGVCEDVSFRCFRG